jgi:serine/threonine protein kinase
MGKYILRSSFPALLQGIAVTLGFELTTSRNLFMSIIFRSTAMPESIIRKVLWQSLLALHHLHTAIDDRPGVVHRALSPEKRESKQEARGVDA